MRILIMRKITFISILIVLLSACEKFENYSLAPDMNYKTTNLVTIEKAEKIADIICNTLNSNELIGVQVSIRDSLGESWNMALGSSDLSQENSLANHYILRIGSVTKIYTSALILKLIELDYIGLEQKLSDFYPECDNVKDVTVKNLLNHSSGITDVFDMPGVFISASNFPDKQWSPEQLAKACMEKDLKFSPGSEHAYSNTNFIILGLIAEKATGKKVTELFSEYLFLPNNLNDTHLIPYMETPSALVNGYVHHFALSLKGWYINEPDNTSWATIGFTAGAMAANSSDLSAFIHRLFSGEIIDENSLQLMTSFSGKYGLGLFKINVNDHYYYGHEGEITGFESIAAYNPETKVVITICCNTTPFSISELLTKIDAEL